MIPHSIIIYDERSVVRETLARICGQSEDIKVAGETGDFNTFRFMAETLHPDLMIIGVCYHYNEKLNLVCDIKKIHPSVKILLISSCTEKNLIYRILCCGIEGYLLEGTCFEEIICGIRRISEGDHYFSEKILHCFIEAHQHFALYKEKNKNKNAGISRREAEVLGYIAEGLTNRQIGDRLCISPSTVKNHRTNLLAKTGAKNTAQLVNFALRKGPLF